MVTIGFVRGPMAAALSPSLVTLVSILNPQVSNPPYYAWWAEVALLVHARLLGQQPEAPFGRLMAADPSINAGHGFTT
tara:strand:- start:460 stop:693 length:234 start_codon:yes stop_codon:yes gene_type:complete